MKVIDFWTEEVVKEVNSLNEGLDFISSEEKEAEMYGWERPDFDIVDDDGNSLLG